MAFWDVVHTGEQAHKLYRVVNGNGMANISNMRWKGLKGHVRRGHVIMSHGAKSTKKKVGEG